MEAIFASILGVQATATLSVITIPLLLLIFGTIAGAVCGVSFTSAGIGDGSLLSQVARSLGGALSFAEMMPVQYSRSIDGPYLKVDMLPGALVDGVVTFTITCMLLLIILKGSRSSTSKTWLLAVLTVGLAVVGFCYTGPSSNPAYVVASEPISHLKLNSKILQEPIIDLINGNPKAGWKAAMNPRFSNYTIGQFKHLLGVKPTPERDLKTAPVVNHPRTMKLPDHFDARMAWPQCSTIGRILDQGHCGSCWAFGAVESLSDRFCVHFGMNISLSVNDLLSCCGFLCGGGCGGGYPIYAWRYFKHHGVVTEECDPYFDNTGCSHPGCEPAYPTPKCVKKCVNKNMLWKKSKRFSVSAYRISSDPFNIMAEVYKNGPVEVSFTVYEDFAHYKSGVYKHMTGDIMGGHAVKLIGWGTADDGEDYWLLANQWNRNWGDDGYFKIKRGTNECGIEKAVVAGLPSTRNLVREFADMEDAILDASL